MKHDAWGEACRNGTVPPEMTTNQIYQRGFAVGVMSLRDVVERLGKQWKPLLRQQDKRFPGVNLAAAVAETTWNECGFGPQYDPDPLYKLGFLAGVQAEFPHHNPRRHWWNTPIGYCLILGLVNGFLHFIGLGLLWSALITCLIFFIPAISVAPPGKKFGIFWVAVFAFLVLSIGVEVFDVTLGILWSLIMSTGHA